MPIRKVYLNKTTYKELNQQMKQEGLSSNQIIQKSIREYLDGWNKYGG